MCKTINAMAQVTMNQLTIGRVLDDGVSDFSNSVRVKIYLDSLMSQLLKPINYSTTGVSSVNHHPRSKYLTGLQRCQFTNSLGKLSGMTGILNLSECPMHPIG